MYAEELRIILESEDFTVWDRLPDILARIVKECDRGAAEDADSKGIPELRMLLCRLASKTAQCPLAVECARALFHFGRPGRVMALDICSMSKWGESEVLAYVERFDPLEKLLVIHQSLLSPCGCKAFFKKWAESRLELVYGLDPKIIHNFCVRMGREGNRPSYLLLQHLLAGGFVKWFQGVLRRSPDKEDRENAVFVVHALGEPSLVLTLAGHFQHLSAPSSIRLCRIAAELCRDQASSLANILVPLMVSMEQDVLFAALRCLVLLQWPKVKDVLVILGRKRPELSLRLQGLAFFLPNPWSLGSTAELVRSGHPVRNRAILGGVCRIDPGGISRICSKEQWPSGNGDDCRLVGDYADTFSLSRVVPACTFTPIPRTSSEDASLKERIVRLFAKKAPLLKDVLHTYAGLEDMEFRGDLLEDRVVAKCTIKGVDFDNCIFSRTVFDRVRFLGCTFTGTSFVGCEFKECMVSRCTFRRSCMIDVTLQSCLFEFTDFSGFLLDACTLQKHTLIASLLHQVTFIHCSLERGAMSMCVFDRLWWDDCRMSSVRLTGNAVIDSIVSRSRWHGVEMISCKLERTMFRSMVMRNTRLDDAEFVSCSFEDLDTLEPAVYAKWLETMFWNSRFEVGDLEGLPENLDPAWVKEVLVAWRYELVARTTEQCMLQNNRRRVNWAVEKFAPGQDDFFRLLPCLLHSARFEEYMDMRGIPGCRIDGFEPDHTQMRLLDEIFPFIKERSRTALQSEIVRIAAVYTIGSLGTVAQNRKSDVDVWICLAGSGPDKVMRSRVVMKCEGLSDWAREEYDLELHFFVMTMDEIRSNNFGMLSREGSGSAQALLLKEEFYRTVLLIGGRAPRWWSLPCRSCNGGVRPIPCPEMDARSCDLGEIHTIPKQEFFGASLWQIVGSARNPYKALLKLGLLEKYALQGASPHTLLSEAIKSNLLEGKQEIYQVDPYGLLYRELMQFYGRLGDREGCKLLKESFHSKIRMDEIDLSREYPGRQEERSLLAFYFQTPKIDRDKVAALGKRWSMAKTHEVGEAMSTFMIGAYQRIRGKLSTSGKDVAIRPEEMTMLGRTISSYFGREPGKVRRMFLIGPEDTDYQELYFYSERVQEGNKVYAARGRRKNAPRVLDSLEVVRRDADPYRLAAWLAVNGLYKSGVEVSGNPTLTPISVSTLQGFMKGVLDIFSPETLFSVRQEDLLEEKRVRKVLCCLHKGSESDDFELVRVDLLYSTSWGELYSMSIPRPAVTIRTDPTDFFARNLPSTLDWEAELYQYRTSTGRIMPLASQ